MEIEGSLEQRLGCGGDGHVGLLAAVRRIRGRGLSTSEGKVKGGDAALQFRGTQIVRADRPP